MKKNLLVVVFLLVACFILAAFGFSAKPYHPISATDQQSYDSNLISLGQCYQVHVTNVVNSIDMSYTLREMVCIESFMENTRPYCDIISRSHSQGLTKQEQRDYAAIATWASNIKGLIQYVSDNAYINVDGAAKVNNDRFVRSYVIETISGDGCKIPLESFKRLF